MLHAIFACLCERGYGLELVYLALTCRLFYSVISRARSLRRACLPYVSAIFGVPFRPLVTDWRLLNIRVWGAHLRRGKTKLDLQSQSRWWVRAHGPLVASGAAAKYAIVFSTSQKHLRLWVFGAGLVPDGPPVAVTRCLTDANAAPRSFTGPVALSVHGDVAVAHPHPPAATSNVCMVSVVRPSVPISATTVRVTNSLGGSISGLEFFSRVLRIRVDGLDRPILYCTHTDRFIRPQDTLGV